MTTAFRNVVGSPGDPVSQWPYEALVASIERGTLSDWKPLLTEIEAQPWGVVTRQIEAYLEYASPYGVGRLLQRSIEVSRADAAERERDEVARRVRELIAASGLSQEQFACGIGTSRSRLSTYANGRVAPSATLLVRMERFVSASGAPRSADRGARLQRRE